MGHHRIAATLISATAVVLTFLVGATPAEAASPYAPLDRPGPRLSVKTATLDAALECHGDLKGSRLQPVLLNPATGVTVDQNYSWNYERAFTAQKRPWCAIHMPSRTLEDIQVSGEYLVRAIRTMHAKAGRRIAVMGHSQGGMSMRWALRFWPDTRRMVDDVIGMAGSNHGSTALPSCIPRLTTCMPAVWQQQSTAKFIAALNSRAETFKGISYTQIYTRTDEVVTPSTNNATASSALRTGQGRITNVATQDVCPLEVYEHLTVGTISPTAYALAIDALDHDGPAKPSRIARSTCLKLYHPGVDLLNLQNYLQVLAGAPGLLSVPLPSVNLVGVRQLPAEPPLRCYTSAKGC
ncbi:lipase family alpha/beta hydrolase [Aeromicrobium stalagmiti]|uniref:lipase family alpha/beta hydrolase n=1 Tax=Aeromicrobium stalagmiti TaxID=2738988 RepID=UPI001569F008|nr:lipase [Aeromicrobium stalagmiti]NRQ50348.1 lipase [Aeromicrobium stalagmiti]